jgi:hypothetical protein
MFDCTGGRCWKGSSRENSGTEDRYGFSATGGGGQNRPRRSSHYYAISASVLPCGPRAGKIAPMGSGVLAGCCKCCWRHGRRVGLTVTGTFCYEVRVTIALKSANSLDLLLCSRAVQMYLQHMSQLAYACSG